MMMGVVRDMLRLCTPALALPIIGTMPVPSLVCCRVQGEVRADGADANEAGAWAVRAAAERRVAAAEAAVAQGVPVSLVFSHSLLPLLRAYCPCRVPPVTCLLRLDLSSCSVMRCRTSSFMLCSIMYSCCCMCFCFVSLLVHFCQGDTPAALVVRNAGTFLVEP